MNWMSTQRLSWHNMGGLDGSVSTIVVKESPRSNIEFAGSLQMSAWERGGGGGKTRGCGSIRRDDKPNFNITFPTRKLFLRLLTSKSFIIPLILVLSRWNTRNLFYSLILYRILRTANTNAIRNLAAESTLERESRIFRFRALIYDSSWTNQAIRGIFLSRSEFQSFSRRPVDYI